MSRAFTVGPRTQTKATTSTSTSATRQGRAVTTKPPTSNAKTKTKSKTVGKVAKHSSSLQIQSSGSSSSTNSNYSPASRSSPHTAASSVKQKKSPVVGSSVSKPRVVTLADLNISGGSETNKKPVTNSSDQKTASRSQQATSIKDPKRTGTKTKTDRNMWDQQEIQAAGYRKTPSSSPQAGNMNVISNRGNGRQGIAINNSNHVNSPGSTSGDQSQGAEAERKATYKPQGGYTLIAPDQKKRDKLQNQRSEELARLDKYKEKKKVGRVSMQPSKIGGFGKSEEETRRQQERELKAKKYEMLRKKQQWAEEKKRREEEEYAEKKTKARQQTERNKQREEERQRELQSDRQAWLREGGLERLKHGRRTGDEDEARVEIIDDSAVEYLREIFPFKSRQKLVEMLTAASGDVNKVIDWLSDR